jgi:hypothetical protein
VKHVIAKNVLSLYNNLILTQFTSLDETIEEKRQILEDVRSILFTYV